MLQTALELVFLEYMNMKFKLTETFLFLLSAQLFERAATYKSVKIIEFKSDFMDGAGPNRVTGKLFKTRE